MTITAVVAQPGKLTALVGPSGVAWPQHGLPRSRGCECPSVVHRFCHRAQY